jgi:hypothetical protein
LKLAIGTWDLGVGSWDLGVGSRDLGPGEADLRYSAHLINRIDATAGACSKRRAPDRRRTDAPFGFTVMVWIDDRGRGGRSLRAGAAPGTRRGAPGAAGGPDPGGRGMPSGNHRSTQREMPGA